VKKPLNWNFRSSLKKEEEMSGKRTPADRDDHHNSRKNKRDGNTMEQEETEDTENQDGLVFEDPFGDEYEEEDVYEDDENDIDEEEEEKNELKISGTSSQAYVCSFEKERLINLFCK
jgi:hypothetical protein